MIKNIKKAIEKLETVTGQQSEYLYVAKVDREGNHVSEMLMPVPNMYYFESGGNFTAKLGNIEPYTFFADDMHRWHDLREDPDDLPPGKKGIYLVALESSLGRYGHFIEIVGCCDGVFEIKGDRVIAWKYLEPFEEVEA